MFEPSRLSQECSADPPSLSLKNGPRRKLWARIQATLLEVTLLWFMVKIFPQVVRSLFSGKNCSCQFCQYTPLLKPVVSQIYSCALMVFCCLYTPAPKWAVRGTDLGKSGRLSGGCGFPPQYWGGGEQQRPGQTENVPVKSLHFISLVVILSCFLTPPKRRGSGDIQLTTWALLKTHSLLFAYLLDVA